MAYYLIEFPSPFLATIMSPDSRKPLRVLLLEDDDVLRDRILIPELTALGFAVEGAGTASTFHVKMASGHFDLVVLDVGLPDSDGFAVTRDLRVSFPKLGVLMLTGRGEVPDQVKGLSYGADAYLAKPAGVELIAATLHSIARRLKLLQDSERRWHMDESGWGLVSPGGRGLQLNDAERRVMKCMLESSGRVVSRMELVSCMDDEHYDLHRLDTVIYRLRKKVIDACGLPLPLIAVHGAGYAFRAAA